MRPKTQKVILAVPNLSGKVQGEIADFLVTCANLANETGRWAFQWMRMGGESPDWYARNRLVYAARKTDADMLWLIDDDMRPSMKSLVLLDSPHDVTISSMFVWYRTSNDTVQLQRVAYRRREKDEPGFFGELRRQDCQTRYVDIDAGGTGSMLIKRRVFMDDRLLMPSKFVDYGGVERDSMDYGNAVPMFRSQYCPTGYRFSGSDMDFVWRAKQLGYSCVLDQLAPMGHQKSVDLTEVKEYIDRLVGIRWQQIQQEKEPENERAAI